MELIEKADLVKTKSDFIEFLSLLRNDLNDNTDEWENINLSNYFEAMEAFLEGSTEKSLYKIDFTPSWSLFAKIMIAASNYE